MYTYLHIYIDWIQYMHKQKNKRGQNSTLLLLYITFTNQRLRRPRCSGNYNSLTSPSYTPGSPTYSTTSPCSTSPIQLQPNISELQSPPSQRCSAAANQDVGRCIKNKKNKKRKSPEEPSQLQDNGKKKSKKELMAKMREEVFVWLQHSLTSSVLIVSNLFHS